jgi:hypothetical protein
MNRSSSFSYAILVSSVLLSASKQRLLLDAEAIVLVAPAIACTWIVPTLMQLPTLPLYHLLHGYAPANVR